MEPLFKLVGEICGKEQKGDFPFSFFVTDLTHQLTGRMLIFLMLKIQPKE